MEGAIGQIEKLEEKAAHLKDQVRGKTEFKSLTPKRKSTSRP